MLVYRSSVNFTYERDDGLARSWIDHIICSQSYSSLVYNVRTVFSGSILSDHFPLCFQIQIHCLSSVPSPTSSTSDSLCLDWHKTSPSDIQKYRDMVSLNLSVLSSEAINF